MGLLTQDPLKKTSLTLLALQTAQVPRKARGSLSACQLFGDFRDTRDLPGWLPQAVIDVMLLSTLEKVP